MKVRTILRWGREIWGMRRALIGFACAMLSMAGCSEIEHEAVDKNNPYALGRVAGREETEFFRNKGDETDHAKRFMAAWHRACEISRDEMIKSPFYKSIGEDAFNMAKANDEFSTGYVDELQKASSTQLAAGKPLQGFVKERWWKSGTGCAGILRETPEWAREIH